MVTELHPPLVKRIPQPFCIISPQNWQAIQRTLNPDAIAGEVHPLLETKRLTLAHHLAEHHVVQDRTREKYLPVSLDISILKSLIKRCPA